jgi:hypothetical protein
MFKVWKTQLSVHLVSLLNSTLTLLLNVGSNIQPDIRPHQISGFSISRISGEIRMRCTPNNFNENLTNPRLWWAAT